MDKRRSFRSFTEILLSFSFRILLLIGLLFLILQGMNVSFRYGTRDSSRDPAGRKPEGNRGEPQAFRPHQ